MKTVIHYKCDLYLPITENWIYGQIKNLKRYRPIVYTTKTQNLDIFPTENIRSLELKHGLKDPYSFFNKGWNKIFNFYPSFAFFMIKDKPNLVHAHFGPSGYSFLSLNRLFAIPLITTFYGSDMTMLPRHDIRWKVRYRKLFQQGDRFLVEGPHMRKCLAELGCPEEKITVQRLGVDLARVEFVPRLPGEDGKIRVLVAGSFREKKGIPYAIHAFKQVREKHNNLHLTIIGDSASASREEKEKQKILGAIDKYRLNDCVTMMGYQPHSVFLRELYKHHIFLSPSVHASDGDTEGGAPVSIIEASASGMPILSTNHCDIPEVVVDRESGYLVPERNIDALAQKLEFLITNPGIWKQMGKGGRKHTEKDYNVKIQVQKLEKIYDKVLEK